MKPRTCPECGASLDPCEVCDCKRNGDVPAATETSPDGNDYHHNSTSSIANPFQDVNNLTRLKELRESTGVMAKEVASAVRNVFPKFNRQLLSQCEQWDKYGVVIHPDGLQAICNAYGLELVCELQPGNDVHAEEKVLPKKKSENRRLGRKLTFRVTKDDFEALRERVQADGFGSVQAWLYEQITKLLGGIVDEHS